MADIRIKDLATTASTTASDDFMAVDGTTNGTRKLSAATPSFATSVTVPDVVGPASTALTLTGGSSGASLVLGHTAGASISSPSKLNLSNTTSASSSTVGALTIGNGTAATNVAIGGGKANIGSTEASTSSTTGALQVAGGLATGAASYFGGDRLLAQKDQNAVTRLQVRNDTSGTAAQSQVSATLGDFTTYTAMGSLSAGFTTSGLFAANSGYITSNATAGLNLFTVEATSLKLGTNNTAAISINATTQAATFAGAVTVSSTTAGSAGAGALVVSGGLATGAASYFGGDVTVSGVFAARGTGASSALWLGDDGADGWFMNAPTGNVITLGIANVSKVAINTNTTILSNALRVNNAYVATPVTSTGYITIQDSTGTTYKVAVAI